MIRVHCFGFAFTPRLAPTLFLFICLPILLSLGFWQLNRAEQKHQLLKQFQTKKTTLNLTDIPTPITATLAYRQLKITGHFDNAHSLLVDNKISHHQVGYEVLTPFIPTNNHRILLVNRGWIAGTGHRDQLPSIPSNESQHTITGSIKLLPTKTFTLAKPNPINRWPARIQVINIPAIKKAYKKPLYAFILLLAPDAPSGFRREWRATVISPEKHFGYAIQWFALSLALVIIYLALSTTRGRHGKSRTN